MARTSMLILASLVLGGCDAPAAPWLVVAEASETADLDSETFDQVAIATASFALPETFGDDIPDAFYRLEATFERAGPLDVDALERVVLRATPLYPTSEGARESTTILVDDAEGPEASLSTYGTLERCAGTAACERQLRVRAGWLTPPAAGTALSMSVTFAVELRGGNANDPPAGATAAAAYVIEP